MLRIYYNARWGKSRAGLKFLQEKGVEFEIREYLKKPLDEKEFKTLLMKLNWSAFDLIRTKEDIYKKEYKGLEFNEDEWIKILIKHPKLMKRPIIETQLKAVWAVPVEEAESVL